MQKPKLADGASPSNEFVDRDGATPGTTLRDVFLNDNWFNIFDWLGNQGYTLIDGDLEQFSKAAKGNYVSTYTYNTSSISTQSVNDVVRGSNGKYYEVQNDGVSGDDPVGSTTGNWIEVAFDAGGVGLDINGLPAKSTPADDDELVLADSTDSFDLKKLTWSDLKTSLVDTSVLSVDNFFHAQDQKPSSVGGGTNIIGTQTRVLNTILTNSIIGASLSANQITLPQGQYYIEAELPLHRVNRSQGYLYNASDAINIIRGTTSFDNSSYGSHPTTKISGIFSIASTKAFELRHYTQTVFATFGLGLANNVDIEIYTDVKIWKVG